MSKLRPVFWIFTLCFFSAPVFAELIAQGPRVGEINPADKEKYKTRYETKNSTIFALGPSFANNLNNTKMLYALTYGYEWEVGSQGAVDLQAMANFGDSTFYGDGTIGGKFFFTDTDISPMIRAGFGLGTSKGPDLDWTSGFALSVGAGLTMFRTSSVHLEILVNYSSVLKANAAGNPSVTSITLGILF